LCWRAWFFRGINEHYRIRSRPGANTQFYKYGKLNTANEEDIKYLKVHGKRAYWLDRRKFKETNYKNIACGFRNTWPPFSAQSFNHVEASSQF
jgi:hypothetical protein